MRYPKRYICLLLSMLFAPSILTADEWRCAKSVSFSYQIDVKKSEEIIHISVNARNNYVAFVCSSNLWCVDTSSGETICSRQYHNKEWFRRVEWTSEKSLRIMCNDSWRIVDVTEKAANDGDIKAASASLIRTSLLPSNSCLIGLTENKKKIKVISTVSDKIIAEVANPLNSIDGVRYASNTRIVYCAGNKDVVIQQQNPRRINVVPYVTATDAVNGTLLAIQQERTMINSIDLSPDEKMLAVGTDSGRVNIYSARKLERLAKLDASLSGVPCLLFEKESKYLVVGSGGAEAFGERSGRIEIWNIERKKRVSKFDIKNDSPTSLALSSDGTKLFVGTYYSRCMCIEMKKN